MILNPGGNLILIRMVIKLFQPRIANRPIFSFRGRECIFWKKKIFNDFEFYNTEYNYQDNPADENFHFLIVFDPDLFWNADNEAVAKLVAFISQCDFEKELIFSVIGTPFFIISAGAGKKLDINLKEARDLTAILRSNKNMQMIQSKEYDGIEILDINKDRKSIENAVIDYQIRTLTANGVTIEDLGHFFVEGAIPVGAGTLISSGVVIKGESKIGANVNIYPHSYIENSIIGDHCTLLPGCIVRDSELEEYVQIGPYTHLRNGSRVKKNAKMGNFVEMKKSVLGEGSKSMHLTYIGDATVGEKVNIGAGTITCNYDGVEKYPTIIEDGVFIGSGTELVAPVVLRKNSYVGAGSTITDEVPQNALAVARLKQRNILDWVSRKRKKRVCKP